MDTKAFGERLSEFMRLKGLGSAELARASGYTQRYINALRSGSSQYPRLNAAVALAEALGVSLDQLAGLLSSEEPYLAPDEEELLRFFRPLSPVLREEAVRVMRALFRAQMTLEAK